MGKKKIYALYKKDVFITEGTSEEICNLMNWKKTTLWRYKHKSYRKYKNSYEVIVLEG